MYKSFRVKELRIYNIDGQNELNIYKTSNKSNLDIIYLILEHVSMKNFLMNLNMDNPYEIQVV